MFEYFEVFLGGLLLGGMYGLIALGLNLQYGVARILNLSYGEFLIGGAFIAFFAIMSQWQLNPLLSLFFSMPIAFAMNWLIYQLLMVPLIQRAPDQDVLDADVVLVTFGLLFVFQGLALVNWSGDLRGYSFMSHRYRRARREGRAQPPAGLRWVPARWPSRCSWCSAIRVSARRCGRSPSIRLRPAWWESMCGSIPRSRSRPAARWPPRPAC